MTFQQSIYFITCLALSVGYYHVLDRMAKQKKTSTSDIVGTIIFLLIGMYLVFFSWASFLILLGYNFLT